MKVTIIGSRNLTVTNLESYLPDNITEIVSGGARGVDVSARNFALSHGIKLTEFLPEYDKYGKDFSKSRTRIHPLYIVFLKTTVPHLSPLKRRLSPSISVLPDSRP